MAQSPKTRQGGASLSNKVLLPSLNSVHPIQSHTDGSVTTDQAGWGFTVKQGVTTIHKGSAAHTVWPVFMVQVDNGGGSSHLPSAELPQEETVGLHMLSSS